MNGKRNRLERELASAERREALRRRLDAGLPKAVKVKLLQQRMQAAAAAKMPVLRPVFG